MQIRPGIATSLVIAAVLAPAAAVAEGIGPHETWYSEHPKTPNKGNDVQVYVHRDKAFALVSVINRCLGTTTFPGEPAFANTVNITHAGVQHGKLSYSGNAVLYSGNSQRTVHISLSAKVSASKVTGAARISGTSCGRLAFVSKLWQRSK